MQIQQHLMGKRLLRSEIPYSDDMLFEQIELGYIGSENGVIKDKTGWRCVRCGNRKRRLFAKFPCAHCNDECTYCRHCLMLGKVTSCSKLFHWVGPEPLVTLTDNVLVWDGMLTKAQQRAANRLVDAIGQNEELLIWAVTGAGKTEMLFLAIAKSLQRGERVLLATPRTDVVLELTPRLRAAFPTVKISSLYGGSPDRLLQTQLVIATTHQVMRFYQAFDFVIIDEIDAFPYSYDDSLSYAVSQAKKLTSSTAYLTATPTKSLEKAVKAQTLQAVKVTRRFHGHPLPVPRLKWCGNWRRQLSKGKIPSSLSHWLQQQIDCKKQAFLFVPSIKILSTITTILTNSYSHVASVHANDPERKQKVEAFRKKQISILVTTTILERGVTIENLSVAVLGAEENIFTESALVQIAGRAGRSPYYPDGDVVFFHDGKTKAIHEAIRHIKMMNEVDENG
ncbi:MAG TPA: DEAD/DEAH box helicase [Bacilli bacterium]|nr:DEAD/DEAH box helicase [Bacilli bacterium]